MASSLVILLLNDLVFPAQFTFGQLRRKDDKSGEVHITWQWSFLSLHTGYCNRLSNLPDFGFTDLVACRKHGSISRNIQEELEAPLLVQYLFIR